MTVENDKMPAGQHAPHGAGDTAPMAPLAANAEGIVRSCDTLDRVMRAGFALPPAGARLLDGYHLLDTQLRLARAQSRQVAASLRTAVADGAARVQGLVTDALARADGVVDTEELARLLAASQQDAPLRVAELDALPALLRLALIDRLAALAARAAHACAGRERAAAWAARFLDTAETRPGDLVLLFADMARSEDADNGAFVAELARRLQGRGAPLAQVVDWIDARLADGQGSIAGLMQDERSEEAQDAVAAGNALASLRALGGVDWRAFAERLGVVDALLRDDPDGSYARMDGATRDRYRHTVARLAHSLGVSEAAVAQEALALAGVHRAPGEGGLDTRIRHVGHYLAGPGLAALEARLRGRRGWAPRVRAALQGACPGMHRGATAALALLFMGAGLVHAWQGGASALLLLLMGILALPVAGALARALMGMARRWLARPQATPRIDVAAGIPIEARTLVAVSAQPDDAAQLVALCEDLEVRYLGNRDRYLRFCLLLDLPDAPEATQSLDAALLAQAGHAIEALNRKHGARAGAEAGPFMLLARARTWSEDQQAWIGRERRRGQLADLNAWLCGERERFALAAGNLGAAAEMRYVIALDADTGLPRDAARSLVAAMAHPLHRPLQDETGRVLEGHAMLLPRLATALPHLGAMRYQRLWPDGGQGWAAIYDVDAWRRAMGPELRDEGRAEPGWVEEDRLRAARVSDLRLDAAHPDSYGEHVLRRHRALRAAWQEARRLGRGADRLRAARVRVRLSDALAGSLAAPASIALLVLCWSLLAAPVFWTAAILAPLWLPALLDIVATLASRAAGAPLRQHLDAWARGARTTLVRAALALAFLPHQAWLDADAVARGLWRRDVSRRKLLELRPPALARASGAMENNWRTMWFAPLLAVGVAVLLTFANPYALFATAPLLLVWFLSPVLAWWVSQPARRGMRLAKGQTPFLRTLARRSWAFFEQHGATRHGLAPEAVYDHSELTVDERVSPSSMGLTLLATLSARDFGYLPLGGLLARSEQALASMALLERWHGHLFQWYDGVTLAPVEPAHVDTAASGGLALALRTFAAGLDELPDRPVLDAAALDGIRATLCVAREHAPPGLLPALDALDEALAPGRSRATDTLPGLADCLRTIAARAAELDAGLPGDAAPALCAWTARLARQCAAQLDDLHALTPWTRAAQEYVLDAGLTRIPTLRELAALEPPGGNQGLAQLVAQGRACARERMEKIARLAAQAREAARMDFGVLVDPSTGLLAKGCHVREGRQGRLDGDACDLLASGARMASFAAVAQDQLPQQHWWSLGRPLRMTGAGALLLSRAGALEDYLAPHLMMPSWRDTLLDDAGRAVARLQAAHARGRGLLWGYTESGCNAVDAAARYRVQRFGLDAAALQRRAGDDLVAAPHGAALALAAAPVLAAANLRRMAAQGLLGETGFYEALDYAPARLPQGERQAVVRAQFARHQAVILLALARHLQGEPMQRRFARDPELRAALGLLQEAAPAAGAEPPLRIDAGVAPDGVAASRPYARVLKPDASPLPEVQLLSNGRYHLSVDSAGAGASCWGGDGATRAGLTRAGAGETGLAVHVRDTASGATWANVLLPGAPAPDEVEAVLAEGRASLRRVDHGIEMRTDAVVAPGDDVELRRIRIVNRALEARTLELTGCVALAGPPLEEGGRSSIRIEFDAAVDSLLCVTAPSAPVVVHRMTVREVAGQPSVETNRARFIGRGHDLRGPQAVMEGGALPGLDPEPDQALLALRRSVTLAPQQEITVDLVLGAASSRALARELAARYGVAHEVDHAIEAAWTLAQAELRRAGIGEADAQLINRLAGCLLQPAPALRADPAVIARNLRGRADLTAYGVTGDLPVLLLQLGEGEDTGLARQLLQAHGYWRGHGLAVDLLVLCDSRAAREALMHLAASLVDPSSFDQPGGLHLHLKEEVPREDRILLRSAASVLLAGERGDLADQLRRAERAGSAAAPPFVATAPAQAWTTANLPSPSTGAAPEPVNGAGGFTPDGGEYVVRSSPGAATPAASAAPWINLLANDAFGSIVSERGHAVSWSGERATRLTAGDEEAIAPQGGEAFYLRDEDSGAVWSPTPWPAPSPEAYTTRHGIGYSVFEHRAHGIHSELRCFVAQDAPLKYSVLRLRNDSDAPRRLSATGYVEWLLDERDAPPGLQVVTGRDLASGALLARNAFGAGFQDKVAFFHVDAEQVAVTCDRQEFIGRLGAAARPAALGRAGLSGNAGAGFDPCAALQVGVTLAPGAECELVFVLGVAGPGSLDASAVVQRHGTAQAAAAAWRRLRDWWDHTLGAVTVHTPDPGFDLRVNRWLPWQAIGAMMGERDPALRLQSALACAHARPELLREAVLRAAPAFTAGASVEDFLWLPYALTRYLTVTQDHALLAVRLTERDDLYQHCVHGLRGCLRFGPRGLPPAAGRLHEEGVAGRVESVRLGFFMAAVLQRFAEVADRRGDFGFATTCRGAALALRAQCEEHGWDGDWYRWTWLDSSNALGSIANAACRVELSTQCWALEAGAAQGPQALRAAVQRLRVDGAMPRCDPPVDGEWSERVPSSPGQDHRATAWAAAGLARLGESSRAWQLARMLDPMAHGDGPPYLMSGGLRTIAPHAGRAIGGFATPAAAWTWLLLLETLLGLERHGDALRFAPRLAPGWDGFSMRYRHRGAFYEITVRATDGDEEMLLDGQPCPDWSIALRDDRRDHKVELLVARAPGAPEA
ncbi:cyclic beta-1,2-glucan synthetase [Massilia sp. UYP11]|uniref:GH36-type glycosyl hydrolase domain-containing protein n=1 Tax=Massilia sp. UYP11 TaxID=1756385 RepID=UPI003D216BE4